MHVGIFLSTNCFEDFYVRGLGLTEEEYAERYSNDFSFEYAAMWQRQGHRVTIYNFTEKGRSVRTAVHSLTGCILKFIPAGRWSRLYASLPLADRTPFGRFLSQYTATVHPLLDELLRQDGVELIYAQEYAYGRFERLSQSARRLGIPIIAAHHGGSIHPWLLPLKRRTLRRAAYLTVLNGEELARMQRELPHLRDRIRLVPNFVRTGIFRPQDRREAIRELGLDESCRYVMTAGRLFERQKGHTLLIRAAALLRPEMPELRVLIAGGGPDEELLRRCIAENGAEDSVALLGAVADKERLAHYYAASELFVLPSRYEGLPLVLLEAGACGLPAAGFDVPGVRGLLRHGENGLLAGEPDAEALAGAMRTLLNDEVLRAAMGREAREQVLARYTEEAVAGQLGELLRTAGRPLSGRPDLPGTAAGTAGPEPERAIGE
ncbi:glycosyltransferase family 4 protein [Paenibacillus glufosinatiresistens]|uniref:glycosyltransferase family 4 protein n=1 Tax=Paenibacillus glufosinatiresistens TaxID=3070657 RepID=UPI00286DA37F|nr:glycosyltransferase family 4 protein [Paenibacillus sp. YX.27]